MTMHLSQLARREFPPRQRSIKMPVTNSPYVCFAGFHAPARTQSSSAVRFRSPLRGRAALRMFWRCSPGSQSFGSAHGSAMRQLRTVPFFGPNDSPAQPTLDKMTDSDSSASNAEQRDQPSPTQILQLTTSFWVSQAPYVAAEKGLRIS